MRFIKTSTIYVSTIVIFLFSNYLMAQDFEKCKLDLSILKSQDALTQYDKGKEFVLRYDNLANWELKDKIKKTKIQVWWEKSRNATEEEIKLYKKRKKAYERDPSAMRLDIIEGVSIPIKKAQQQPILAPEFVNDSVQIKDGILYSRKSRAIRADLPIFLIQDKDSSLNISDENGSYILPIGIIPVFDTSVFQNSTFVLNKIDKSMWGDKDCIDFIVDNKKVSLYNYKYKYYYEADYPLIKELSGEIFYDKKRLSDISAFLSESKSKNLTIELDGKTFINPQISLLKLEQMYLSISFTYEGNTYAKKFKSVQDPEYRYNYQEQGNTPKTVFDLPIYYSDCYSKTTEQFKRLTLKSDYINNPNLKKKLENALSYSKEWMNYEIIEVILTPQTQWVIRINKYTGLKDSRITVADAYVRNTIDGQCYYQSEVMFIQKADPIEGFIYQIVSSSPQSLQQYPCDLK